VRGPAVKSKQPIAGDAEVSDETLLRRHLDGEAAALGMLVERHLGWVHGYLASRLRKKDEADDLTQEVFLRVSRAAKGFRFGSKPTTWLFTIMTNVLRTHLKRSSRGVLVLARDAFRRKDREATEEGAADPLDQLPGDGPDLDESFESRRRLERLRDALGRLPERQQRVLVLSRIQGLPLEEVAALLDMNLNTVKTTLHRARLKLAKELAKEETP
jgi:RNA polymerase sigma-70 factor (ECF subfamily)